MTKPKLKVNFIVDYSQKEALYICFLAKNISRGLYSKDNFYVLPYLEKQNIKAVYFPYLKLSKIFWKEIANSSCGNFGDNFPNSCVEEVMSKLPQSKTTNLQKIIDEWRKKEDSFFTICETLFYGQTQNIKSIEFLLTEYGTLGSFMVKDGNMTATYRIDIDADGVGRKLLYMFTKMATKTATEIGEDIWYQRRTIVNYMLEHTELRNLLPMAKNTAPRKRELILKNDSENYLSKLGFNFKDHVFKVSQWGKITIKDKDVSQIFTAQEEVIIKNLIKNKGEIVGFNDFDQIPSLYALAKVIENIRRKIKDLGINKEIVTTIRGKGYLINQ